VGVPGLEQRVRVRGRRRERYCPQTDYCAEEVLGRCFINEVSEIENLTHYSKRKKAWYIPT
jgi:hypothetical protein